MGWSRCYIVIGDRASRRFEYDIFSTVVLIFLFLVKGSYLSYVNLWKKIETTFSSNASLLPVTFKLLFPLKRRKSCSQFYGCY